MKTLRGLIKYAHKRTIEGHKKIPSEDTLFDFGDEGGQLSA